MALAEAPQLVDSKHFRIRWLGQVPYEQAWDLQNVLFEGSQDHLLLLEHPPVYTLGLRGTEASLREPRQDLGADVLKVNRGGDVTFHGPGQLVGYPVMTVESKRGSGLADTARYINDVEQLVIDTIAEFGLVGERIKGCPGVWLDADSQAARKIAAVGVRLSRGRSMHGFALNVDVDLDWFEKIVPCGIADKGVTSLKAEGVEVDMQQVAQLLAQKSAALLAPRSVSDFAQVAWKHSKQDLSRFSLGMGPGETIKPTTDAKHHQDGVSVRLKSRLDHAGVTEGLSISSRKPDWMQVKLRTDKKYLELKKTTRDLNLTTVCEEAGCPNIFDCWNEGTATFMLLGERCTRACGFCLVDTRKPESVDEAEPARVAKAVKDMGIKFAVLTMVARDDLADGGAEIVAQTVKEIHQHCPGVGVEVLISDLAGSRSSLETVCDSQPEILNHNIETVARLQRAVRPSAGYAKSLTLLARAKSLGMTTKSGIIVGMGETREEVEATLADLAAVGTEIVTIGQYLRPTSNHLPVARWWTPAEFDELKLFGEQVLGIGHVASSPLTRSSHHAGSVAESVSAKSFSSNTKL